MCLSEGNIGVGMTAGNTEVFFQSNYELEILLIWWVYYNYVVRYIRILPHPNLYFTQGTWSVSLDGEDVLLVFVFDNLSLYIYN